MAAVLHLSISLSCPPSQAYAFASDPRNLPRWAAGLAQSEVVKDGEEWAARAPFGKIRIRFAEQNPFGVLDHWVTLDSGKSFYNPMRVVANGEGSEFLFTLFRQPEMTDEEFDRDKAAIEGDLKTLKSLLEHLPSSE